MSVSIRGISIQPVFSFFIESSLPFLLSTLPITKQKRFYTPLETGELKIYLLATPEQSTTGKRIIFPLQTFSWVQFTSLAKLRRPISSSLFSFGR